MPVEDMSRCWYTVAAAVEWGLVHAVWLVTNVGQCSLVAIGSQCRRHSQILSLLSNLATIPLRVEVTSLALLKVNPALPRKHQYSFQGLKEPHESAILTLHVECCSLTSTDMLIA